MLAPSKLRKLANYRAGVEMEGNFVPKAAEVLIAKVPRLFLAHQLRHLLVLREVPKVSPHCPRDA